MFGDVQYAARGLCLHGAHIYRKNRPETDFSYYPDENKKQTSPLPAPEASRLRMSIKVQLAMIGALVAASLLLLRWSPTETVKSYVTGSLHGNLLGEGGKGQRQAQQSGGSGCVVPSPKPPVSIEWTGRESMTVSYKEGVDVEVYKHEFPGSTLCECVFPLLLLHSGSVHSPWCFVAAAVEMALRHTPTGTPPLGGKP